MKLFGSFITLLFSIFFTGVVYAGDLRVSNAWVSETLPAQNVSMAEFSITSKQAASLVGVSSSVARAVEMHRMSHENGMMKMREVQNIELPAGQTVNFRDSGYHLMLIGLKSPLKAGASIPLVLSTQEAGQPIIQLKVMATVRATSSTASHEEDAHQHHH